METLTPPAQVDSDVLQFNINSVLVAIGKFKLMPEYEWELTAKLTYLLKITHRLEGMVHVKAAYDAAEQPSEGIDALVQSVRVEWRAARDRVLEGLKEIMECRTAQDAVN